MAGRLGVLKGHHKILWMIYSLQSTPEYPYSTLHHNQNSSTLHPKSNQISTHSQFIKKKKKNGVGSTKRFSRSSWCNVRLTMANILLINRVTQDLLPIADGSISCSSSSLVNREIRSTAVTHCRSPQNKCKQNQDTGAINKGSSIINKSIMFCTGLSGRFTPQPLGAPILERIT